MDPMIIVFYAALLVVIWFFFIRPQTKKAKEQGEFISKIQKGDRVVTTGGLHGRIASIDDEKGQILLEVESNVKLRMERSAISLDLTNAAYGAEKNATANSEKK
jgi:preprotein translocase subunit YajC